MRIRNSLAQDGFIAAQDFRKPKSGEFYTGGVVALDKRAGEYCVRIVDRQELGHYAHEKVLAGDMLGPTVWEQSGDKRPCPAWMKAWPVTGSIGAAGGTNVSGVPSPKSPGGEVPADSRNPIAGTGNAALDRSKLAGSATGGSSSTNMIPLPPTSLSEQTTPPDLEILPIGNATGNPEDDRFKPKKIRYRGPSSGTSSFTVDTSRKDGTIVNLPRSFPAFAKGSVGILLPATVETEQVESYHPTDPRLIAPNRNGAPGFGSVVCDMTADGAIDDDATALLQSAFRVVLRPRGTRGLASNSRNTLAINIGRDGQSATVGSLVADGIDGKKVALGRLSVRDGGPLDCVAGGCLHSFGTDGDGNKITPVHFSDLSLWRTATKGPTTPGGGNTPPGYSGPITGGGGPIAKAAGKGGGAPDAAGDGRYDGPLHFQTPWPKPPKLYYPSIVEMGFDDKEQYRLPRDGGGDGGPLFGKWKWWTTCVIGTNGPGRGPTDDKDKPPKDPPGGPGSPGGDNGGGPITPGGGNPAPGAPGGDNGGGPGSPGGDGGGGPTTPGGTPGFSGDGITGPGESPPDIPGGGGGGPTTPSPTNPDGGPWEDAPFWIFFFDRTNDDFWPPPSPGDIGDLIDGFPGPFPPGGGGGGPTTPGGGGGSGTVDAPSAQSRSVGAHNVTPNSSSIRKPRIHGVTVQEIAMPSVVGRPQMMHQGAPDLRYGQDAVAPQIAWAENRAPQVLRSESFGKQAGATFVHTQAPGNSRSLSGTGTGGTMDMVPEHDMTDVAFNSTYGASGTMTGVSEASRIIGYGVTLAFGKPSLATGKPTESVGVTADYTNKSAKFRYYDAGGTPVEIVEIANQLITLADQVNIATNTGTGTTIATSASQKLGFFGAAAVQQPAAVADATGGVVEDVEARAALNALLSRLRDLGLIDT